MEIIPILPTTKPKELKTTLTIQADTRKPHSPERLKRWNKKARKKLELTHNPRRSIIVPVDTITNKRELALGIARNYGDGLHEIKVRGYHSNKEYNKEFRCTKPKCVYLDTTIKRPCTISNRWRKGWSCRANPINRVNWTPVAKIKIKLKKEFWYYQDMIPEAYKHFEYSYKPRPFKMTRYKNWFWKGE